MIAVGVDPGATGAMAFAHFQKTGDSRRPFAMSEVIDIVPMPLTAEVDGQGRPDPRAITDICHERGADLAVMEWPFSASGSRAPTREGMRAEFTFRAACGLTLAGLMALSEDPCVHVVEPFAWKGALALGPDKRSSLRMASGLLGARIGLLGSPPSHDRAEALLLLRYLELFVLPSRRVRVV